MAELAPSPDATSLLTPPPRAAAGQPGSKGQRRHALCFLMQDLLTGNRPVIALLESREAVTA